MLFLPPLCLLGTVVKVTGQEWGYLHEALKALDLPLGMDNETQLQKNKTGVLITSLLQAVHCAERTGTSQEICEMVRSTPVTTFTFSMRSSYYIFTPFLSAYSIKSACYGWNVSECEKLNP